MGVKLVLAEYDAYPSPSASSKSFLVPGLPNHFLCSHISGAVTAVAYMPGPEAPRSQSSLGAPPFTGFLRLLRGTHRLTTWGGCRRFIHKVMSEMLLVPSQSEPCFILDFYHAATVTRDQLSH